METKSFKGKVALVTGGSRGIGAGIVRRLAADGASVAFTYCSSPEKALELVREIESVSVHLMDRFCCHCAPRLLPYRPAIPAS